MTNLLLITADYPPRYGGVANYYAGLHNDYSQMVVLTSVRGESNDRIIRTSWQWPGWPKWFPLLWIVPFWKIKTKARYLAAGEILPIGTALLFMRICFGWQYIVFVHGFDIQLACRNKWKKFLARKIIKYAECIVVNSKFTRSLVENCASYFKRIEIIYPPVRRLVSDQATVSEIIKKYSLSNKIILLTVSRLVKRKAIDLVINSVLKIKDDFSNIIYVVIGDGPERENLEKLATRCQSSVIFTGSNLSNKDLAAWYELSDIFILTPIDDPVDVEGFGIVYLEAQQFGKPVIARAVGGVPEAVGEGGWFIKSSEELPLIIKRILTDNELRESLAKKAKANYNHFYHQTASNTLSDLMAKINIRNG